VVRYSGFSRQTVHNYTTMGLLHESQWTRGGHRLYDESVFERLDQVIQMKRLNKSMQEIREHFDRVDQDAGDLQGLPDEAHGSAAPEIRGGLGRVDQGRQ